MKEKVTFGPIKEKLDEIIVQGQWEVSPDCKVDCEEKHYTGDEGGIIWGNCTPHIEHTSNVMPWW